MKPEAIGGSGEEVSLVTTPKIVYDDPLLVCPSTFEDNVRNSVAKRLCGLSEIVLASSLALTTPGLSLPELRLSDITHLSTSIQMDSRVDRRRRITLREARHIALRGHYQFEAGLREDRIREARLMEIPTHENEA